MLCVEPHLTWSNARIAQHSEQEACMRGWVDINMAEKNASELNCIEGKLNPSLYLCLTSLNATEIAQIYC